MNGNAVKYRIVFLYHGSSIVVEKPHLLEQTRGLDFGAGFYLTSSASQAERFSEIVTKRQKSGSAIVNTYEFGIEAAGKEITIRRFNKPDAEWLRFVTENRLKAYRGDTYDIVIGAVANDTLMPVLQAFWGGFMNEEAALVALKTSKLVDQYCFKSDKALSFLRFVNSYGIKGDHVRR